MLLRLQAISSLVRYMSPVNRRRVIEATLWGISYFKRLGFSSYLKKRYEDTEQKAG